MNTPKKPTSLLVCTNNRPAGDKPSCGGSGSRDTLAAIAKGIQARKIDIEIEEIVCLGHCNDGPAMRLAPGGAFFHNTRLDDVPDILDDLERRCGKTKGN